MFSNTGHSKVLFYNSRANSILALTPSTNPAFSDNVQ